MPGSFGSRAVVGLVALCAVLSGFPAAAGAAPAAGKLTIKAKPDGVSGGLASEAPSRCAANRPIVVFRKLGKGRDPRRDQRVGATRSGGETEGFAWSLRTGRAGWLYAAAAKKPGCAAALSGSVRSHPIGQPVGGGEKTDYPPCSPYTSESFSRVCRFEKLSLALREQSITTPCRLGNDSGECLGEVVAGLFPWSNSGTTEGVTVKFVWLPGADGKLIRIYVLGKAHPDTIIASLIGTVPNAGSPRFSIIEGYAQNDKGFPFGDYFSTPDLPGQAAGEPGGPLGINFQSKGIGATVDITGYLYLRL